MAGNFFPLTPTMLSALTYGLRMRLSTRTEEGYPRLSEPAEVEKRKANNL